MSFPTNNCDGRIVAVPKSTGGTLTRASIVSLTPSRFSDFSYQEIDYAKYYGAAVEARMAGYKESTLMALLNGRTAPVKWSVQSVQGSPSIIQPYISRRQKRVINVNYWKVASDHPAPGAGSGNVPVHARRLTIENNPSPYATVLPDFQHYFVPGKYLSVQYTNASNAALSADFKILSATAASSTQVYVVVVPNYSALGWGDLSAAEKAVWQPGTVSGGTCPTGTIGIILNNSISDYESWGGQSGAVLDLTLIHFWLGRSRFVFEYDDEYKAALENRLNNPYFTQFLTLPLAEQRRQIFADHERETLMTAFYGREISEGQNVNTWQNATTGIEPVYDLNDPNQLIEYKARPLGFERQLEQCSRIIDHAGQPLDFDALLTRAYQLKRAREVDSMGASVDVIDYMGNRFTAGAVHDLMIKYFKAKYGANVERHYAPNQKLVFEGQAELMHNKYELPAEFGGMTIAMFHDRFFDDLLVAGSNASRHRQLWGLDWTDIQHGVANVTRVNRVTNESDALYRYVPKVNKKHVDMMSVMSTNIIEDPNRHDIVRNFSDACPKLTVASCDLTA